MKNHLLGLALFSLIVGTAVFFSVIFSKVPEVKRYEYSVSAVSCQKNINYNFDNGKASVKIIQSVLNNKTNQLYTSYLIQRETPSTQSVQLKLTYFRNFSDQRGFDGIQRTEYLLLTPDFNVQNKAFNSVVSSYQWLDDFNSNENLYIKAEIVNERPSYLDSSQKVSKISTEDFTPVLLKK